MTEGTGRSAVRRVAVARGISLTGSGAAFTVLGSMVYRLTDESAIWLSLVSTMRRMSARLATRAASKSA